MEEESYQEKIAENEKQEQEIHAQIQTIMDTLNQLKQNVEYIKAEVEEMRVTELLEKMNLMMHKTDDHLINVENEMDSQNKDVLKEEMNQNSPKKTAPRPSEYRTLQNMLQSSNNVELTSNTLNSSTANNRMYRQPTSLNQNAHRNSPIGDGQHTVSRKGTKTFRNSQKKLNNNIITRSSTSRNRKK